MLDSKARLAIHSARSFFSQQGFDLPFLPRRPRTAESELPVPTRRRLHGLPDLRLEDAHQIRRYRPKSITPLVAVPMRDPVNSTDRTGYRL